MVNFEIADSMALVPSKISPPNHFLTTAAQADIIDSIQRKRILRFSFVANWTEVKCSREILGCPLYFFAFLLRIYFVLFVLSV